MMNRDNFRAAFGAILQDDEVGARKFIAAEQRTEHGQKEWTTDTPTKDVCGDSIVFKDLHGFRYTVSCVRPDGAHVRTYFDPTLPVQVVDVEARAHSWLDADVLMAEALAARATFGEEVRPVGGQRQYGGMYLVRYRASRPSLD